MIETSANESLQKHNQHVKMRINHPKLHHHLFTFPKNMPFQLVLKELKRDNVLSLFENYHFEIDETALVSQQNYASVISQKPQDCYELDLIFEHYKYATAMHHFKAVSQLLKNPNKLHSILRGAVKGEVRSSNQLDMEVLTAQLVPEPFRGYKWDIEEVIFPSYHGDLHHGRPEKLEFVQFLEFSGFNPPPAQAQFAGDYFYLHLKTLENMDIHITACANGFYVNQSKVSSYNPTIQNAKPNYISLLDLLAASSEKLSTAFNKLLETNPSSLLERNWKKNAAIISNLVQQQNKWLDCAENEHHWNARKEQALKDIEGGLQQNRDWNQQFVELSRMSERISDQGERWELQAYRQLYAEFTQAASQAARKIIQGKVKAINYMDQEKRHIYIYNNIFMSATTETPLDHRLSKEEEVLPSSSSVSTDILNLERLHSLKPKGIRLLQTLLVSYRGWRMLVQTIIPGLLTSQLNAITLYGALDDAKSIQADERFHKLLLPICRQMNLDDNIRAIDKSDEAVTIAVSPEIKGIKSTSGEYFLCDLQKFSPRDFNYLGIEHEGCVIRHKLLNQFIQDNKIDFSVAPPINTNIGTDTRILPGLHQEEQEKFLQNAARYLKQTAIPRLINALKSKNPGDFLTDSAGIAGVFHDFGVNMRYLGFVERHQHLKENIEVRICLARVILVRSIKHLFRSVLRNAGPLHISSVASHILNCIFAKKSTINQLSATQENVEERTQANESKRKKKRKNREEEKQVKMVASDENRCIRAENCRYLNMKPQEIWDEVCRISKARFDYLLEPNILAFHEKGLFRLTYQKYAALRDVCLSVGLVLERKDYSLSQSDNSSDNLPFASRNILYFNTISKTINLSPSSQLLALKSEADRLFTNCSYKEALTAYMHIVNLIRQRKDGETLFSYCLGQVSRIEYMLGNLRQAIMIQTQNLMLSQKMGRQDCLEVTRCYSRLGLYCMSLGAKQLSLWLLYKGLHLMLMSFGEAYPDILINFANIARVHQQNKEPSLASSCYLKAIELLSQIYGSKNHVNTSFCYSSLASLHYELGQLRKSVDYQGEAVAILQKVLSTEDMRYNDATKILKMYREFSQNKNGNRLGQHKSRDRKK